jgi:hypothetical protein
MAKKPLIFHYLRMYPRILSSCRNTFGIGTWFFYYLLKIPVKLLYVHLSLFLDNIFFPGYRRVEIKEPVFIIGHPRSGTTFLHTLLTSTEEFLVFKDWELNHPSLTIRKLLKHSRMFRILLSSISDLRFSPYRLKAELKRNKEGMGRRIQDYKQNLELIAQEEELLFLHILDTQFLTLETPLGFVKQGYPEICFHDDQPHQEKSVLFFRDCLRRQIYYTGRRQVLAKINFSLFRIKTLLKVFPDAKIIYLARSPLETIPSHFSLHRRLLDRQFGLDNIPEDGLRQYFSHRYHYNILFYKYFEELMEKKIIPENQILEISYDSLKNDLRNTVNKMKSFANLRFSPELESRIDKQAAEQASYRRKHKNLTLEELNLSEEKIRSDFDFVFKRYGFA